MTTAAAATVGRSKYPHCYQASYNQECRSKRSVTWMSTAGQLAATAPEAATAATPVRLGGAGGGAGRLGSNGKAGDGNEIKIVGSDGSVTFEDDLLADGGSVGPYTGIAGHGGDGKGPGADDVGGNGAESSGINGSAGGGGSDQYRVGHRDNNNPVGFRQRRQHIRSAG